MILRVKGALGIGSKRRMLEITRQVIKIHWRSHGISCATAAIFAELKMELISK
jgi:hypothetical protein